MRPPASRAQTDAARQPERPEPDSGVEAAASHAEDLGLVRKVLGGDTGAIEVFVQRMGCARRFLAYKNASFGTPLGRHELEDALQSTLLAVWRKLEQYAGTGSLEAWVYRFAFLELMNRLQELERRPRGLVPLVEDPEVPVSEEPAPDPLEREKLYRSLAELEPDTAEIIRLKHMQSRTFEEIAMLLTISANTAKTRYYRGMERLRRLLGDSGTSLGSGRGTP